MTDSTMTDRKWQTVQWQTVQWQTVQRSKENKDKRIIKFKSKNHQHEINKSKLKVGKIKWYYIWKYKNVYNKSKSEVQPYNYISISEYVRLLKLSPIDK